ncbi:MAG: carboxypeptidase-like regulatory domain-containing protein [Thermoproteota archaeon]
MARQHFRKRGHECLLPYALLLVLISLCEPVIPILGYNPVKFIITDFNGKPLKRAIVALEIMGTTIILPPTNEAGITQSSVPIPQGSYRVTVMWKSSYSKNFSVIFNNIIKIEEPYVFELRTDVYDVILKLVMPSGMPIADIIVKIANVIVGVTDVNGTVSISQIPSGTYAVDAEWLGTRLTLPSLTVTTTGPVTLTPTNVHRLTIRVIGAQGQALEGATVRVTKGAVEVTRLTDKDGKVELELPDASYNIEVTFGQFSKTDSVTMTADTLKTFNLDVFIEFLGVGMSMAQFLLFIVMNIIIVIVLAIGIHEYHIYRRKSLPQLFGEEKKREEEEEKREERRRKEEEKRKLEERKRIRILPLPPISPGTLTIIIVAIIIAIGVTLLMSGLIGIFLGESKKIVVKVDVKIYSPITNIGVLNEEAVFNFFIQNLYNSTKMVNIVIKAQDIIIYNETVAIEPGSSKNMSITQKLIYTGLWTIQLFVDEEMIYSHSFETVVNRSEADVRINQWNDIVLNRAISIVALVISALSLVVSILNFRRGKKEAHAGFNPS